jgi:hypothetical protein
MRLVSSECRRALILYRRYQAWLKRRDGAEPPNVRIFRAATPKMKYLICIDSIVVDYLAHRRHGPSASAQASGDHGQRMSAADQTNGRPPDEDFVIDL